MNMFKMYVYAWVCLHLIQHDSKKYVESFEVKGQQPIPLIRNR